MNVNDLAQRSCRHDYPKTVVAHPPKYIHCKACGHKVPSKAISKGDNR
jgi:hypothetical protein